MTPELRSSLCVGTVRHCRREPRANAFTYGVYQLLIDLDKVVTDQQAKIMELEELVTTLIERVRSIGDGGSDAPQDERPPHY